MARGPMALEERVHQLEEWSIEDKDRLSELENEVKNLREATEKLLRACRLQNEALREHVGQPAEAETLVAGVFVGALTVAGAVVTVRRLLRGGKR
jgi:hypothetical protein